MTSEIQEAALQMIRAGLSVFPVKAKNSPGPWEEFMGRIITEEEVPKRFNGSKLCAVVGGAVSGNLIDLDIDDPDTREPLLAMIKAKHPDIQNRLVFTKTPNGYGILFRSESLVIGNHKIAKAHLKVDGPGPHSWKDRPSKYQGVQKKDDPSGDFFITPTKLETKGERGYFLVHPSPGYEILQGSIEDLKPIPDQDVTSILAIARLFHEIPGDLAKGMHETTKIEKKTKLVIDYPGTVYAKQVDCSEILKDHGWVKVGRVKNGTTWGRPGAPDKRIGGTL